MTRPAGRYAPSPTGSLHLGNLRTALAAYLSARSAKGRFLLRIEDIDRARSKPEFEAMQLRDLATLGIEWDEEPVRQSDRTDLYAEAVERLRGSGHLFECFCSRKDLREFQSAPHEGEEAPYPGTCRDLAPDERAGRISEGRQHCLRLHVEGSPTEFNDGFAGRCTIDLTCDGGDFIVRRADGEYAYQIACAVDDAEQGITEVVRGDDLLVSGQRQLWLLECLGRRVPGYVHIPLMHGPDGRRLAKREGSEDLAGCLARGFDADGVRAFLAWSLGQCASGARPSMGELIDKWDPTAIPRKAAQFDPAAMEPFRT